MDDPQALVVPEPASPDPELVDVESGERLPATVENAAAVLGSARKLKAKIDDVIRDASAFLAAESMRQGTKTFHTSYGDVTLSGGPETRYDPEALEEALRAAGCPEERLNELIRRKVEYTVDRRILRQVVAANPAYREAAASAEVVEEKPYRASVKS